MPETLQLPNPAPLTTLTEDEILFRDNVRQFADDKIRPLAKEMDEKGVFDHALLDQFFQLGLMGRFRRSMVEPAASFLRRFWQWKNFPVPTLPPA
jgi:alkylation response protein AidB-like acyl-CoA dehydrogenase